jgi:5-methyltetrahydrofolate--homocysteine methyltransferase
MWERQDLTAALRQRVLLADGAMGTMLQAAGLPPGTLPELWNRDEPERVRAVHRAYLAAGSDVILTNSFGGSRVKLARATPANGSDAVTTNTLGGSRVKLERAGLGEAAPELCRLAAQLGREAAGDGAYVFGSIGPTGELLSPLGTLSFDEARDAFAEQAAALAGGGADAILVETMSDVEEARAAIQGAHTGCSLPVICTFSFDRGRRTMMGVGAQQVTGLWDEGLLAIGANCGRSLEETLAVITDLHALLPDAWLMAKPNAGVASLGADGKTHFDVGPGGMAAFVPCYLEQGVRIIGGCCGSTPAHIRAIGNQMRRDP